MLELLRNDIIITWVAPIFTGLIVIAIPAVAINFFKSKKDEKAITQANQRYIDAIMPFIIQEIELSQTYISDIRHTIINENNIKDKFIYTEIELRNRLIIDISESKYIDEDKKNELINFTYTIFKHYETDKAIKLEENNTNSKFKNILTNITNPIILFIISQLALVLILIFDKRNIKPEENVLLALPLLVGLISIVGIIIQSITGIFESKIKKNRRIYFNTQIFEKDLRNFNSHYIQNKKSIQYKKIKHNN